MVLAIERCKPLDSASSHLSVQERAEDLIGKFDKLSKQREKQKSQGEEIRMIAGAVNGGAALVVQPDANLKAPNDFKGKRIATPQLGNTQDISCRAWLASGGLKITQLGGDAQVLPTQNPDQLFLFQQKKIDAVWTVEPWVSRLETEAGDKVLVEEPDTATTVLVSSLRIGFYKTELKRRG